MFQHLSRTRDRGRPSLSGSTPVHDERRFPGHVLTGSPRSAADAAPAPDDISAGVEQRGLDVDCVVAAALPSTKHRIDKLHDETTGDRPLDEFVEGLIVERPYDLPPGGHSLPLAFPRSGWSSRLSAVASVSQFGA
jgi:hypothetical protein